MFSYFVHFLRLSRMRRYGIHLKKCVSPSENALFMYPRFTRSLLLHHLNLKHIDRLHVRAAEHRRSLRLPRNPPAIP